MEDFSMEAVVIVADEKDNSTKEVEPANFSETRGKQRPEIEQPLVEQAKILDLTKLSYELQQGYRVYTELLSDSYKNVTWPFFEPVDAEALGLWDYHEKIKEPMSFSQIGSKFNNYEYSTVTEVISDIRLILENCYRYNGSGHWVSKLGQKLEKILEQKLALLNRSLRDKVSLKATMALKRNFIPEEVADGIGRRRCTPRVSYLDMLNGDSSSSLLTHLKIQEDIEERERRRIREKEKKEANLVLLQDLAEWEEKELSPDVMKQLHSMWEIPSLAGFLFLLKDVLYLQDISVAELELSFVYANKSSLLAKIYTALLLTPHQRKSLFKKPVMKFKVWELKLCDRVNSWYKAVEKDGQEMVCSQCGLDMAMFDVLGDLNPLLEKSYMDLTLHQRVWVLKCLCDNSLMRDHDVREQLTTISPTDQRELLLGSDADNWQYLYFPLFSSVDLRIYKQCPSAAPALSKRKKKVPNPPVIKEKKTQTRPATPVQTKRGSRLRKLRHTPSPEPELSPPPSPQPPETPVQEAKNTISEGFEMVAYDIDSLKKLREKFEEPTPPPKKRGRKPKPPPPRKRCEVDLHQTLSALLEDLEKYETSFSKLLSKAKIRIMKESMEPDPVDEPEEVIPDEAEGEWGSEESIGDEIEDAGAKNMSSDEDFVLEDEGRRTPKPDTREKIGGEVEKSACVVTATLPPQKRKAGDLDKESKPANPGEKANDVSCSIAVQTALPRLRKKKRHLLTSQGSQATAACTPNLTAPAATQVKRLLHIPACLQQSGSLSGKDGAVNKCLGVPAATTGGLARVFNNNTFISTKSKQEETNVVLVKSLLTGQKTSVAVTPSNTSVSAASRSVGEKPSVSVTPSTTSGLTKVVLLPSGEKMPVTDSTLVKTVPLSKGHVTPSTVRTIPKTVTLSTSLVTPSTTSTLPRNATISTTRVTPSVASTPPVNVTLSKIRVTSTSPALAQTASTLAKPASSSSQTIPAVQYLTLSNACTTKSGAQDSALISTAANLGQVMFVTSSGVPLKVIRTVPITQGVVQVKALSTQGKQTGTPTSQTSHLSRNSFVLTPAKSASVSLSNTVCTPLLSSATSGGTATPPVLVVQPSGSGGVLPFSTIKGGTVMVPTASASQKLVILKSPNVSASTTSVTSSQGAKTTPGQKVVTPNIGSSTSINSVPQVKRATTSVSMVTATSSSDKISVVKPVYVNSNGVSWADGDQTTDVNTTSIKVFDSSIMNESAVADGFSSTESNGTEHPIPTKKAKQVEEKVATETNVKDPNSNFSTDLHEASVDLTCYETSVTDSAAVEPDDSP